MGDPAGFEGVFDRHFDDVYRFIARRLGRDVVVQQLGGAIAASTLTPRPSTPEDALKAC
jgi:hypothetical protein